VLKKAFFDHLKKPGKRDMIGKNPFNEKTGFFGTRKKPPFQALI
jgi:hypothetical protein